MKRLVVIFLLVLFSSPAFGKNLVLVEFQTNNYDSLLVLLSEIESRGFTTRHIFAPNFAVLDAHELNVDYLQLSSQEYKVYRPEDLQSKADFENPAIKNAFLHITTT